MAAGLFWPALPLTAAMAVAAPEAAAAPQFHFAIRRRRKYATLLIDAVTYRRVDVLPGRHSGCLAA
jgi:hypothetical protein